MSKKYSNNGMNQRSSFPNFADVHTWNFRFEIIFGKVEHPLVADKQS